ncbi:uncharacterized protein LOC121337689 [Onychostruthus taczanowskii]|uniref:uncharacterized protein LOC121337689 n=1 Tax=Onychostruthus taczanowskii TaxID=356909 RepID=UPI001B80D613|nr:uncharacterized protein LOC121337689 [Onychostruthus taczanowskii]
MISEYKPKYKLLPISDFLFEDAQQKLVPILKFFFVALSEELHFINILELNDTKLTFLLHHYLLSLTSRPYMDMFLEPKEEKKNCHIIFKVFQDQHHSLSMLGPEAILLQHDIMSLTLDLNSRKIADTVMQIHALQRQRCLVFQDGLFDYEKTLGLEVPWAVNIAGGSPCHSQQAHCSSLPSHVSGLPCKTLCTLDVFEAAMNADATFSNKSTGLCFRRSIFRYH